MRIDEINDITSVIIGCAHRVHSELGPGLLESVYEAALAFELIQRKLHVQRQVALPVRYKGLDIETGYRLDLLVENVVVLELKSIDKVLPMHRAQLLTYLRMLDTEVGLILNFSQPSMQAGIHRVTREFEKYGRPNRG